MPDPLARRRRPRSIFVGGRQRDVPAGNTTVARPGRASRSEAVLALRKAGRAPA
jgi:hypothetical protein